MLTTQKLDASGVRTNPEARYTLAASDDAVGDGDSMPSVVKLIQKMADDARAMIGAHQAILRIALDDAWSQVLSAVSFSDKYSIWKTHDVPTDGFGLEALLCPVVRPMRLTHAELLAHPVWKGVAAVPKNRPPLRGWLAVPLVNRLGRNFGMIELTDKDNGDFDADDELQMIQIARITSLAVEDAWQDQSAPEAKRVPMKRFPLSNLQAELGKALAKEGDLRKTLQASADAIARHSEVALTRIWVFQGGVMKLYASAGLLVFQDDARARVPVGQFSIGHIARTRLSLLTNSIVQHPHIHDKEWSRREGMTAFAGCPLLVNNELEGVIAMFDNKPITALTFDALTTAARDIALAVKRYGVDDEDDLLAAPLGAALERAEHAVIVSTLDGTITDWNSGAEKFFGHRRDEALGQALDILIAPDRADEHRDIMKSVGHGVQVARPETVRIHKTGRSVDVRLTVSALRDSIGTPIGAITVAHDLAEIKQLEQQYCLAQKMEIFGQLAGGVAHDFNNLLTVILGYSEIVISRLTPNDSVRDLMGEIHKAGERAETLTRQLLAFSRKKVLEPKVLDLNAVVSDTEKMLRRLIGEDILMTTIFAPNLKPVKVDPGQMQQVILNLAVNARDAMPRGGRLTIETANVTFDEGYILTHPHVVPGKYILFAMSDTGVGMNPATQARIFEPLFTTKGPGKGTGLGLATVHTIVKQYGGHIEVFSEVGYGSTFKVYLPQAEEPVSLSNSHPNLGAAPRGSETILLVEDERSVRSLAQHVLSLNGYKVLEATNGEEAIRLADRYAGPIHLLVSDVVMPHLGGVALAERLLAVKPQLKVLFLSGYTNDALNRHGVLDTDYAFLQKPFSTSALAQKVRDVLDEPVQRR
jgi:two-component system cell cycle sensor histidine kinase/response regulator CckA